jgi:hypothetical protein
MFPYLKEEIRIILYTWNESLFGNICSKIMESVFKHKTSLWLFAIIHFFCFYGIRFIQAVLFCNFVFFHGDLRWNIYLLPLSFLSWSLRFFEYYLRIFFYGSCEYLRLLLNVTLKDASMFAFHSNSFIVITEENVNVLLTPYAVEQGFSIHDLSDLFLKWSLRAHLTVLLKTFDEKLYWFNIFIIMLRLIAWLSIAVFYFSGSFSSHTSLNGFLAQVFRRKFLPQFPRRSPPTEAFGVRPNHVADLEKASNGTFKAGHYASVDKALKDDFGNVCFEGSLTHGPGSPENPSHKIHETKDLKGAHPKGQSSTFAKPPIFVPAKWFNKSPVPNSKDFYEDSETRVNIAKANHTHKEEEYP